MFHESYTINPTYRDPFNITVQLTDTYGGAPLANVPTWLQIGITPNSLYTDFDGDDFGTMMDGQYLFNLGFEPPTDLMYSGYAPQPYGSPTLYPFYNWTSYAYEMWAPHVYQTVLTDSAGFATFNNSEWTFNRILEEYQNLIGYKFASVENLTLYYRIWYSPAFNSYDMQLPQSTSIGSNSYSTSLFNESLTYDYQDSLLNSTIFDLDDENFYDGDHMFSSINGTMTIQKEDAMLISKTHTVTDIDNIFLSTALTDAEYAAGEFIIETEETQTSIAKMGLPENTLIPVSLHVVDQDGMVMYTHPTPEYLNANGSATFAMSITLTMLQDMFSGVYGSTYRLEFEVIEGQFYSAYYNFPMNGTGYLKVPPMESYRLDGPNLMTDLGLVVSCNSYYNTQVIYTN
ncbi:MAG: hypothetical protein E4G98_05570 [Promethearchaeota archaeon]|nr:MAG: hypothetical protein E4G98_05570 [Candidatus Lokiarchaeota archaeon]